MSLLRFELPSLKDKLEATGTPTPKAKKVKVAKLGDKKKGKK